MNRWMNRPIINMKERQRERENEIGGSRGIVFFSAIVSLITLTNTKSKLCLWEPKVRPKAVTLPLWEEEQTWAYNSPPLQRRLPLGLLGSWKHPPFLKNTINPKS